MQRLVRAYSVVCGVFWFSAFLALAPAFGAEPNWSRGKPTPVDGWQNPYGLTASDLEASIRRGRHWALQYPVDNTATLVPVQPFKNFLELPEQNPFREFIRRILKAGTGFRTLNEVLDWVGMNPFPTPEDSAYTLIPEPFEGARETRMGFSVIERDGAKGFTVSCAACHSANLFGHTVLGLQNRFPRVNAFFSRGKELTEKVPPWMFGQATRATPAELKLYEQQKKNIRWMNTRIPATLGLDTSLPQVALSLALREPDAHASRTERSARSPRRDRLETEPSDSKPGTWWNVRFKNRWLLDGSVVSGNPILTNLLWNEIGHGSDLHDVGAWLDRHPEIVRDLVNLVFHSEPPRYTDFFPVTNIRIESARRGEKLFVQNCASCHGTYEKAWSTAEAPSLSQEEMIKTTRVLYPEQTPVVNVGTDAYRFRGMTSLEEPLNRLELSQRHGIVVETQAGYVPPPLLGIWSRWPYFHNNSAPSLCDVLTASSQRPREYWAGAPVDRERDFDDECNGYPRGARVPAEWKKDPELKFDTRKKGLSNAGHDEGIFLRNGQEILSSQDKRDLIQFLKTL